MDFRSKGYNLGNNIFVREELFERICQEAKEVAKKVPPLIANASAPETNRIVGFAGFLEKKTTEWHIRDSTGSMREGNYCEKVSRIIYDSSSGTYVKK